MDRNLFEFAILKSNPNAQPEIPRNSKARFTMELSEATVSLNADRKEMAEKEQEREKLEHEYKVYMAKCKKRIEWIFVQDSCTYLFLHAQVMIYSKVSPPEKIADCDIIPYMPGCDEGYSLTAQAGGKATFKIECLATAEFEEPAECLPVECGAIPDIPKATPTKDAWKKYGKGKESVVVFPESVPFTCNKGYSLTGVHGGEINFETECKSDGSFSKNQYFDKMCLPVTCGIPELVKHSIWLQPERFYLETVTYACLNGYTLTGEPTAESIYTMTCEHEGRFDVPYPECMPVVCGDAPDFNPNNPSDRTPEVKGGALTSRRQLTTFAPEGTR